MPTEKQIRISGTQFRTLTRSLIGLPVARPWRGYGSAVFLELGQLTRKYPRTGRTRGEAGIMIQWSWRVESMHAISFGSFSGDREMNRGIRSLACSRVREVTLVGRLPEIYIRLTGGKYLHSFMTTDGEPQWAIFLQDGSWLSFKGGHMVRGWPIKRDGANAQKCVAHR